MAEPSSKFAVRRVVIALDAVCDNVAALEAAVRLAARWGAEVSGLFLEDPELRRLAGLPFVQQVTLPAARREKYEESALDREMVALARRCRRDLEAAAQRFNLSWSFEILKTGVRGVETAASEADLLVISGTTRPFGRHWRLETHWHRTLVASGRSLLLLRAALAAEPPVGVVYDGSPAGERALTAAMQLVGDGSRELIVLLAAGGAEADDLEVKIRARMAGTDIVTRLRRLPSPTAAALRDATRDLAGGVLVIGVGMSLAGEDLEAVVSRFGGAVLLVQ
jgi:hypothetical protein